jgi:hypothetical protein
LAESKVSVFGHWADLSPGIIKTESDKYFIHTFQFLKLFPIKIYQNYSGKATDNRPALYAPNSINVIPL